jgi:ribosomal protein L37AE/L43A
MFNRGGRDEARKNLEVQEDGDCPRCGGDAQPSSIPGYLQCVKCQYEWPDPNAVSTGPVRTTIHDESKKVDEFKEELEKGSLRGVLGLDSDLSKEQEATLGRLQNRWMDGMAGHFNAAEEERKPLMISFDDEDNIVATELAVISVLGNDFDGGEEIRVEYPGRDTEFYSMDATDDRGWRVGRAISDTCRNIASIINRRSTIVHAESTEDTIVIEPRDASIQPTSVVIFVDDPGGKNMLLERDGRVIDVDAMMTIEDYREMLGLVVDDGVITPSEDELLWIMRSNLGISDEQHMQLILNRFGEGIIKECPACHAMTPYYPDHGGWWCESCQNWV